MHDDGGPKVSVIMVACNAAGYIRAAADSIVRQAFTEFEFIVGNDGSTDQTTGILESYSDPRMKIITHAKRTGIVASRIEAIAQSTGRYIAVMDADDISLPHRLGKQVLFLDAHPDVALVGANFVTIDEKGRALTVSSLPLESRNIKERLRTENCFAHSAVMFRRDAYETVGGYRGNFKFAEDFDLYLRMSEYFSLANLEEPLVQWRITPHGSTITHASELHYYRGLAIASAAMRKNSGRDTHVPAERKDFREEPAKNISQYYHTLARAQLYRGSRSTARAFFKKAAVFKPLNWENYFFLLLTLFPARIVFTGRRISHGILQRIRERSNTDL